MNRVVDRNTSVCARAAPRGMNWIVPLLLCTLLALVTISTLPQSIKLNQGAQNQKLFVEETRDRHENLRRPREDLPKRVESDQTTLEKTKNHINNENTVAKNYQEDNTKVGDGASNGKHTRTADPTKSTNTDLLSDVPQIDSENPFGYPLNAPNGNPYLPTITGEDSFEYLDKASFRIVVLTMNRPKSLERLLSTLLLAKFDDAYTSLHISIDVDPDTKQLDPEVVKIADSFNWPFGDKFVIKHDSNIGLIKSWLGAWTKRSHRYEIGVILEDDLVVSPFFARWLKYAHAAYGSRDDISGFSLQRPIITADQKANKVRGTIQGPNAGKYPSFLYRLLGTWGFSPRWESWHRFLRWYEIQQQAPNGVPVPVVDGLVMSLWYSGFRRSHREGSMWSMWHIRYSESFQQFTVFSNLKAPTEPIETTEDSEYFKGGGLALANSYQDKGLHVKKQAKTQSKRPVLDSWDKQWNGKSGVRLLFPENPIELDFDGSTLPPQPPRLQITPEAQSQIWQNGGTAGVNIVNKSFLDMARSWLCNILQSSWANEMPLVLWLALDSESVDALEQFKKDQIQTNPEYKSALDKFKIVPVFKDGEEQVGEMKYGENAYWKLMWSRTEFILRLLHSGVNVFLFESDCTWLKNGLTIFRKIVAEGNDVVPNVTPSSRNPRLFLLNGGLIWLQATAHTQRLWEDVNAKFYRSIVTDIKASHPDKEFHSISNDQSFINQLLGETDNDYMTNINKVKWAGAGYDIFPDGRWYTVKENRPEHPYLISNNWIRGIDTKIKRAKAHNHWFYDEKSAQCINKETLLSATI